LRVVPKRGAEDKLVRPGGNDSAKFMKGGK